MRELASPTRVTSTAPNAGRTTIDKTGLGRLIGALRVRCEAMRCIALRPGLDATQMQTQMPLVSLTFAHVAARMASSFLSLLARPVATVRL